MKATIIQILTSGYLALSPGLNAQTIKNSATETFAVSGNCDMCEKTIEDAANKKGLVKADWNVDSKKLKLTYDSKKTNTDEILKRVAYAGYDNEKYLAPDAAYSKLNECCKYKRSAFASTVQRNEEQQNHKKETEQQENVQKQNQLEEVYALYFETKDALVNDDQKTASAKAKSLYYAFEAVKMDKLSPKEHSAFMKDLQELKTHAEHISKSDDIEHQREHFTSLSKMMYELMKVIKPSYSVYLDHCPMYNDGKGADWISKDNSIKNPYYGSKMLTCGKVKETIK